MTTGKALDVLNGYLDDGDLPGAVKLAVACHAAAVLLDDGHDPKDLALLLRSLACRAACRLGYPPEALAELPHALRLKLDRGEDLTAGERFHANTLREVHE